MVLFNKSREIFWKKSVAKFLKNNNRKAQAQSLTQAKYVGVFFVYSDFLHYTRIEEFIRLLEKNAKKVDVFAFIDAKEPPPDFPEDLKGRVYTRKDLDWKFYPKKNTGNSLDAFLSENFDIFINLSRTESMQSVYVTAVSKAGFKMGMGGEWAYRINDVTYELPEESEFSEYLSMIMRYTTNFS